MTEPSAPVLRVDPSALTDLIATIDKAALDMSEVLTEVRNRGRLHEPWCQDPISIAMADHYNEVVFGPDPNSPSPYSTLGALIEYRRQLVAAADSLRHMQADYQRVEAEIAAGLNRSTAT